MGANADYVPAVGYWYLTREDGSVVDISRWDVDKEANGCINVQRSNPTAHSSISIAQDDIHCDPLFRALIPEQGCLVLPPSFLTLTITYFRLTYSKKKRRQETWLRETSIAVSKTMRLCRLAQLLTTKLNNVQIEGEEDLESITGLRSLASFGGETTIEAAGFKPGVALRIETT